MRIDLTGRRFGYQTVVKFAGVHLRHSRWVVRCDCGDKRTVDGASLLYRNNRRCRACTHKAAVTHGLRDHPMYRVWADMLSRCRSKTTKAWPNYGGRGISVCDRWLDFSAFWADMSPTYRRGLTIERIDNDGNYEPSNCTWITHSAQARNRRTNRYVNTPWGCMTMAEASKRSGVDPGTLYNRLKIYTDINVIFSRALLYRGRKRRSGY